MAGVVNVNEQANEPGVVVFGMAQELQSVFSAYDRKKGEPGPPSYICDKADRIVALGGAS